MSVKTEERTNKAPHQLPLETTERAELFYSIFERSADAIFVSDSVGTIKLLNRNAELFANLPSDKIVGHKMKIPSHFDKPEEITIARPGKEAGIAQIHSIEIKVNGKTFYASTLRDITELVRLREELRALTFVDDLVGLCNRRGFFMLAQQQLKLANRTKKGLYLLLITVDNFKQINDTRGQQEANALLVQAAQVLKDTFRKSDIIARVGEDMFAVLAIEAQSGSTDAIGNHLLSNLEKHNARVGLEHGLLASMGTAYYDPEHPCSLDELLGHADMLLYRQKRGRRKSALLWYLEQDTEVQRN